MTVTVWAQAGRRAAWHALVDATSRRTACGRTVSVIHRQASGLTAPGFWLRCGTCHELELVKHEQAARSTDPMPDADASSDQGEA